MRCEVGVRCKMRWIGGKKKMEVGDDPWVAMYDGEPRQCTVVNNARYLNNMMLEIAGIEGEWCFDTEHLLCDLPRGSKFHFDVAGNSILVPLYAGKVFTVTSCSINGERIEIGVEELPDRVITVALHAHNTIVVDSVPDDSIPFGQPVYVSDFSEEHAVTSKVIRFYVGKEEDRLFNLNHAVVPSSCSDAFVKTGEQREVIYYRFAVPVPHDDVEKTYVRMIEKLKEV